MHFQDQYYTSVNLTEVFILKSQLKMSIKTNSFQLSLTHLKTFQKRIEPECDFSPTNCVYSISLSNRIEIYLSKTYYF